MNRKAFVVPPSLIAIESGNKVKTDKRDNRKLATLLENHMLKRLYVLEEEDRVDRDLLRPRRQLVGVMGCCKFFGNHSMVALFGATS